MPEQAAASIAAPMAAARKASPFLLLPIGISQLSDDELTAYIHAYKELVAQVPKLKKSAKEGWHGFRRGRATNLERIGVREAIAAMVLRHSNDRVTRKHYIKPP